jgi:hypothetical protein
MKRAAVVAFVLFAMAAGAVFAFAVWPTPWTRATMNGYPVRIHRFTGEAHVLTPKGWRRAVDWVAEAAKARAEQARAAQQPAPVAVTAAQPIASPKAPPDCKGLFDDIVHDECKGRPSAN